MALRSLLVDFNSYFASVEQELRKELRGKPVAVVPVMAETTCCIAASYEAKRFGIKTGTQVRQARLLCPKLEIVQARPKTYVECHHQLVEAVESCLHIDEVLSIDEMICDLPNNFRKEDRARGLAKHIKQTIARKVGQYLKSSIGIAPNRFLAKMASNMQKPNGLICLQEEDLPEALYKLELRDIHGVGKRMEQRLREYGITTVYELCHTSKDKLRQAWNGVEGERIFRNLRGEEVYYPPTKHTTIGHSHVLPPEERNRKLAFAVINRLTQKAAMRLRNMSYMASAMHISIKHINAPSWRNDMQFLETQDTLEFIRILNLLWDRYPRTTLKPLAVGVTFFNLTAENNYTPSFFSETEVSKNRKTLHKAMDELNTKFGNNTIYFGGAYEALRSAPMRIAFNHIPDLKIEDDGREAKQRC